jgi:glycerophosphoryl diester phosphodiesterase
MSATTHAFLRGLRPTLHISHRGGSACAPENTMLAFREAIERWKTDVLELDVHATRDGVLVVHHDPIVDRCTDGTGAIATMTAGELAALDAGHRFTVDGKDFPHRARGVRIPRFRELLDAFPSMHLNVELKSEAAGAERLFVDELRAANAIDRVCIGSEDDALGARLHALLPDACHFYPRDALTTLVMAIKSGAPAPSDDRFAVLDMPLFFGETRLVDDAFLTAARAMGKWVNVWTVDDEAEMRRCVREGVGGVMTDRPDVLRRVLSG